MIEQSESVAAATATRREADELPRAAQNGSEHPREMAPAETPTPAPSPPWYRRHRRDLAGVGLLMVAVGFLWGRGRHVWYWIDEGIAVGIASQPLSRIPELLSQDGAPPLYYLLLHGWIALVGTSEAATHLLSLLFALATIPAALWAGWSLFGRRSGWLAAALAALNPFLAYYANETRMYSLVALLCVLAVATFLHAFVFGRRRYLPAFALSLTAGLYSHNWVLFVGLALGAAIVVVAFLSEDRRRVLVDGALALGAVALAYAPWLPTLAYQMEHSGAPWLRRPTLLGVRSDVLGLVGGGDAVAILALGLALGLAVIVPWPWPRRAPKAAIAVVATATIIAGTVAVAWMVSRQDSVWTYRYLAVLVGPLVILFAAGLARGGRLAMAAFAVYALLNAPIGVKGQADAKSNVRNIAQEAGPWLQPGDLVVTGFGRVPVIKQYLPDDLRFAETTGLVAEGPVSDQRDPVERLQGLAPGETLPPLLDAVAPGGQVLVMCPPSDFLAVDETDFVVLVSDTCGDALRVVRRDPRFDFELKVEHRDGVSTVPEDGYLFTKGATS